MHTLSPLQNSPRIAPLAVLPVFFTLAGRRAVAIGGGEPVTWKVELLAATGAHVDVYTEAPGEDLLALARRVLPAGSTALHARRQDFDENAPTLFAVGRCLASSHLSTATAAEPLTVASA
jgi:uroporphyrin-III C-methyltransferase/precorrin-2 dehydrogenase/sirohydrochlorin ferrochelatase